MPTMERHFVEFAKKDGYNEYSQDLFVWLSSDNKREDALPVAMVIL